MLDAGAEPWPKTSAGHDLAVGGATVVVGTDGGAGGHVALSHDAGGDESMSFDDAVDKLKSAYISKLNWLDMQIQSW